jgi:hypothetical protein
MQNQLTKFQKRIIAVARPHRKLEDRYSKSYLIFLDFFRGKKTLGQDDCVIGMYFSYGWMPKILKETAYDAEKITASLNKAKKGEILSVEELTPLIEAMNNSFVGVSKLLHFINPDKYAILDSRVFRYVFNGKSIERYRNDSGLYRDYIQIMNAIRKSTLPQEWFIKTINGLNYVPTKLRAIELLAFKLGGK